MRAKIGRNIKSLLAAILSLVLFFNSSGAYLCEAFAQTAEQTAQTVADEGEKNQEKEYTELTFQDWDTEVNCEEKNVYSLPEDSELTSLDGTAVMGTINFHGEEGAYFAIGGSEEEPAGGFTFMNKGESLQLQVQGIGETEEDQIIVEGEDWEALKDGEIDFCATFDLDEENGSWIVGVYLNEKDEITFDCGEAEPGLYLSFSEEMSLASEEDEEAQIETCDEKTYKELKFSDFGKEAGEFNFGTYKLSLYNLTESTDVESLDGVAISGKVNFNGVANRPITIGGTDSAKHGGFWLKAIADKKWQVTAQAINASVSAGTSSDMVSDAALLTGEVELRITFDKAASTSDWTVTVYAGKTKVGSNTFSGATPGLYLGVPEGVTVDMGTTQTPATTLNYGLGELVQGVSDGAVSYASTAFVTDMVQAYGVNTFRVWMPNVGKAVPNGNGGYTVSLDQEKLANVKTLVSQLKANGVTQILAFQSPLIPDDVARYVDKNGNTWTQAQVDNKEVNAADLIRKDSYAFPEPGNEKYTAFMKVQEEYFKQLAAAIPDITHYEGVNEPEKGTTVHKIGWLTDAEKALLSSSGSYTKSSYEYTMAQIAQITMDYNHAMTAGVKASNASAKILSSGLMTVSLTKDYLKAAYAYIKNSDDKNTDNYFEILNWHPYVFLGNAGDYSSESGLPYSNADTWDEETWKTNWVQFQKDLHKIAEDNGDGNKPVWFTEFGVSDCGDNTTYGTITEDMTASRLKTMFELVQKNLSFVDTVIFFRMFDMEYDASDFNSAYEGNFGMIEEFDKINSSTGALKAIGKTFYEIVKGTADTDLTSVSNVLAQYYRAATAKQLTFSDWSKPLGKIYGVNVYSLQSSNTLKSLEGAAVSGTVNFNGVEKAYFRIGGNESAKHAGFTFIDNGGCLKLVAQSIGVDNPKAYIVIQSTEWKTLKSQDLEFYITFEKNESGEWLLSVTINGTDRGTFNCGKVNPGLYLACDDNVTIEKAALTPPEEKDYTEMTFSDWSVALGKLYNVNVYSLPKKSTLKSLDGVAVSGKVNFNGAEKAYFRIGGNEKAKHAGFTFIDNGGCLRVLPQGIDGDDKTLHVIVEEKEWTSLKNKEFNFRATFDRNASTGEWSVGVYINDVYRGSFNCGTANPGLYLGCDDNVTIERKLPEPPTGRSYKELTFSDWTTAVGKLYGLKVFKLSKEKQRSSLNGVAVTGNVNFKGIEKAYFRIGGNEEAKHAGFTFIDNGGCLRLLPQGIDGDDKTLHVIVEEKEWKTLKNQKFKIRMTFDKDASTGEWYVGVYINDVYRGEFNCGTANPGTYLAYGDVDVERGKLTPDDRKYTELKFEDWGIYCGESAGFDIYRLKGRRDITSLHGVAISGKVNFNGESRKYISIGGTAKVKHAGFWIGAVEDGWWLISAQGIGGDNEPGAFLDDAAKFDEEVELRMTFYREKNGDWTIGVYADDTYLGDYICEDVNPKLYLGVRPEVDVEGLGDAVKYAPLDFTLFGYQKETWRKEIGLE